MHCSYITSKQRWVALFMKNKKSKIFQSGGAAGIDSQNHSLLEQRESGNRECFFFSICTHWPPSASWPRNKGGVFIYDTLADKVQNLSAGAAHTGENDLKQVLLRVPSERAFSSLRSVRSRLYGRILPRVKPFRRALVELYTLVSKKKFQKISLFFSNF